MDTTIAPSVPRPGASPARWAAIGAAVAVSLGAGGLGLVSATGGSDDTFVPITPCRLADTRPAPSTVGARDVPIGPGETVPFAVHGGNGDCVIPAAATGVVANVTAVSPTSDSFVTLYPADVERPNSSNLNLVAGAPATPNQVTVRLPISGAASGVVNVFNERGQVDLIIDLVGYFAGHDHDDRYYTQAEVDSALYTRDQIDGLAANALIGAGAVASDGSDVAGRPRFGDWTAVNTGTGKYTLTFPGATDDCGGDVDVPLLVVANIGTAPRMVATLGSGCSTVTGDVTVNLSTYDNGGILSPGAFSFVAYLPGPGQLTP